MIKFFSLLHHTLTLHSAFVGMSPGTPGTLSASYSMSFPNEATNMVPAILNNMLRTASSLASFASSKREAIKWAREEANAIIEQGQRRALGLDQGVYRDDAIVCDRPIHRTLVMHSLVGFALSARFAS